MDRRRLTVNGLPYVAIVAAAYLGAFALRFDLTIPGRFLPLALATLPLTVACKLGAFWSVGVLASSWRHLKMRDVEDIVRGNVLGSVLLLVAMVFLVGLHGFPRAVFLID